MAHLIYSGVGYSAINSGDSEIHAGDVVVNGKTFGVAAGHAAIGDVYWIDTFGTFELPAASTAVGAVGALAYWDATEGEVTATAGTNLQIGYFTAAKASGETVAKVAVVNTGVKAS